MAEISRRTKAIKWALLLAIPAGLIAQLAVFSSRHSAPDPLSPAHAVNRAVPDDLRRSGDRVEKEVARVTFDGAWPLASERATLVCTQRGGDKGISFLTVLINGREYRLNGTAHMFPELGAWWLDSEDVRGAKVSITDMLNAARALCAHK